MDQKPRLAFNTAQGACPMWVRKTVKLPEPQIKQTSASINLTENKIIRHIQKKSLKCEICLLKFSNGKFLKEHQQKIHVEKKIMLSKPKLSLNCMKCSTSFQNHQDLKEHIWTVHERKTVMKIDEFFQCPQCPQTCPTKHGLTVHIGHSHEKQKSYICSICDKEVQSKRNLSNHMAKIHEGKKPYRCSLCDKKTFTSMRTISIHYTKFHPAFASRTNLASHIMKVFQSTDNEEEMESENLKSNEGNVSIDKGKTDIEMNKNEPESTKQMKNVKFADQSDTAIIEVFTQNEITKNIQEKSIKIEADEYIDFHLDDLIA